MDVKNLDVDEILPKIGEFGKYQKLLLWLVFFPACFPCAMSTLNQLFMSSTPEFRCKFTDNSSIINSCLNQSNYCEGGWEFDQTGGVRSVVTDFGLVCDKSIYPTIGLAILNVGSTFGVYYFGRLNDFWGRKRSYFIALTIMLLGNIISASASNFYWWVFGRFVVGLTLPALYQIPVILFMELVGTPHRVFASNLLAFSFTSGMMALAIVAYFVRNWIHLTLATSLPFFLYYFYWPVFPESPRWQLSQGRLDDALTNLKYIAKVNGKQFDYVHSISAITSRKNNEICHVRSKKGHGFRSLCRHPNMRLKTFLITLNWFTTQNVYLGFSYIGPSLGSNEYFSFLLSSAVEIPSFLFCYFVMDRWGRRWPLCLCTVLSGISCIATVLLPLDAQNSILAVFLVAKFFISTSFLIMYPFGAELYPTEVRAVGIGFSTYISLIGGTLIPFIVYLGTDNLILPLLILGVLSMIGGLTSLRLPETLHQPLLQTLEEGEEFGKDFKLRDCLRCVPLKVVESDEDHPINDD